MDKFSIGAILCALGGAVFTALSRKASIDAAVEKKFNEMNSDSDDDFDDED